MAHPTPFSLLSIVHRSDDFAFLEKCIASVYASEVLPTQWVIVCNGDLPAHYFTLLESHTITLIKTPEIAFSAALNKGLAATTYDLVARIDSDDKVHPSRFAAQISFMEAHPHIDILGSAIAIIDNNDETITTRHLPLTHQQICAKLWTCPMAHPSVIYRKEKVHSVGGYSDDWHRAEDFHLWLKLYKDGAQFANLESALTDYRQTAESFAKNSLKAS